MTKPQQSDADIVTVNVRGIADIKDLLGSGRRLVPVAKGTTVQGLLDHLSDRLGEVFRSHVRNAGPGVVYPAIRVMVNGRDVSPAKRETHVLSDGDEVLLLTPLGWG